MDASTSVQKGANGKIKEAVQCIGQDVRRAASSLVDEVGRIGQKTRERGGRTIGEMESRLEGYLQSHPIRTVAVAVGAGLVLGWLTRRRRAARDED